MNEQLAKQLDKVAPKVAAASPSKASAVWSFFKATFFPMLPGLVKLAVDKSTSTKDEKILREVRDVLVAADLGDSE